MIKVLSGGGGGKLLPPKAMSFSQKFWPNNIRGNFYLQSGCFPSKRWCLLSSNVISHPKMECPQDILAHLAHIGHLSRLPFAASPKTLNPRKNPDDSDLDDELTVVTITFVRNK